MSGPFGQQPSLGDLMSMLGHLGAEVEALKNQGPGSRQAVVQMPKMQDLGGDGAGGKPPWFRAPYRPTAPFYSTRPDVGYTTRFYSQGINSATDTDYAAGTESIRVVQFDNPAVGIWLTGSVFNNAVGNALPVSVNPLDLFLVRFEYVQGDQLTVNARLGSNVLGTAGQPGEVGGVGWVFNTGSTVTMGITPLVANLRIDVTIACLEFRGPSNFVRG